MTDETPVQPAHDGPPPTAAAAAGPGGGDATPRGLRHVDRPTAADIRPRMPEYRGAELDAARGPGLGCFWFQAAVLAFFVVLIPIGVMLKWPYEVLAVLLFVVIGLLLFVGQTVIFLLRLVAADRRGRRRPLSSATRTVGEIDDERASRLAAAERGEVAPPDLEAADRGLVDGAVAVAVDMLRSQASFVPFAQAVARGGEGPELFTADLAAEAESLLAEGLQGYERVALVTDARAELPDLAGPRDVIRVDLKTGEGATSTVLVPYVREGQSIRVLPGMLLVADVAGSGARPGPGTELDPAALPPGAADGMRE